eukprot:25546-Pelagococcus_subviridis.AAC.2
MAESISVSRSSLFASATGASAATTSRVTFLSSATTRSEMLTARRRAAPSSSSFVRPANADHRSYDAIVAYASPALNASARAMIGFESAFVRRIQKEKNYGRRDTVRRFLTFSASRHGARKCPTCSSSRTRGNSANDHARSARSSIAARSRVHRSRENFDASDATAFAVAALMGITDDLVSEKVSIADVTECVVGNVPRRSRGFVAPRAARRLRCRRSGHRCEREREPRDRGGGVPVGHVPRVMHSGRWRFERLERLSRPERLGHVKRVLGEATRRSATRHAGRASSVEKNARVKSSQSPRE